MQNTFGYTESQYKRFRLFGWLMLLSFGLTYLFFYNGRQNINLVMTLMEEEFGTTSGALGMVTSALFWCYAFGWPAVLVTIGTLYIIMLILTLVARKMKTKRI